MIRTLEDAFWHMHAGLVRQAPGSDASTEHLLELASLPDTARHALDIGCGPGRSALVLAQHGLEVTAIDTEDSFLTQLKQSAREQDLEQLVTPERVSMFAIPYADSSFDVIWSEGAAYIAGWDNALEGWQHLLRPDGKLILTECCWLTDAPSIAVRAFWDEGYPTMLTVPQAVEHANTRGYTVEATYILPDRDWWDEYYTPLQQRINDNKDSDNTLLQEVIASEQREINLRKTYPSEYGYVGFVLSRTS